MAKSMIRRFDRVELGVEQDQESDDGTHRPEHPGADPATPECSDEGGDADQDPQHA